MVLSVGIDQIPAFKHPLGCVGHAENAMMYNYDTKG